MSVGTIAQASIAQTISYLGSSFTINRQVATGYDTLTSEATTSTTTQTVKGIIDNADNSGFADLLAALGAGQTDVRGRNKAVIIPAKDLRFIPGVGDQVASSSLTDSIRNVQPLYGAENRVLFYRLVLENA